MNRLIVILVIVATGFACGSGRSEPEEAVYAYAAAVVDGRCADALGHLSARTRRALDVLQIKPQNRSSPLAPEEYYCRSLIFENCQWKETKLDEMQADKAKVSMMCGRTQDSILPGFSSIFLKYEPRATDLVFEDGEWRVAIPFVIRKAEARESEDRMIEAALQRENELRRKHASRSKPDAEQRQSDDRANSPSRR